MRYCQQSVAFYVEIWHTVQLQYVYAQASLWNKMLFVTAELSIFIRLAKSIRVQTSFILKCAIPSAVTSKQNFSDNYYFIVDGAK